MYEMTDALVHFWSHFILPNQTARSLLTPEHFYDQMVKPYLDAYTEVYFERMCVQYLGLMEEYQKDTPSKGREGAWYGEKGTIPMVMEDREGGVLLMYAKWSAEPFKQISIIFLQDPALMQDCVRRHSGSEICI